MTNKIMTYEEVVESSKIPNYLIEAYKGFYEDEIAKDQKTHSAPCSPEEYPTYWAKCRINDDTPKEHLRVYLHWNGIIGYDEQIFNLASGSWFNG